MCSKSNSTNTNLVYVFEYFCLANFVVKDNANLYSPTTCLFNNDLIS